MNLSMFLKQPYIAIGAAVIILIVLIVVIIAVKRRNARREEEEFELEGTFLTQVPLDTLSRLGKPERPVEEVTFDPVVERHAAAMDEGIDLGDEPLQEPAPAQPQPRQERELVPLASIIATTSTKMIDLADPDVRRMLTDLVRDEIDQAVRLSGEGRVAEAVAQLAEAERISRALGMEESAQRIRTMLGELQVNP